PSNAGVGCGEVAVLLFELGDRFLAASAGVYVEHNGVFLDWCADVVVRVVVPPLFDLVEICGGVFEPVLCCRCFSDQGEYCNICLSIGACEFEVEANRSAQPSLVMVWFACQLPARIPDANATA